MRRNEKGITLIALVVTIVVLLILAGVSISLVLGNNGLISKAKDAVNKYAESAVNDQADINSVTDWIDEQVGNGGNGDGSGEIYGKAEVGKETDKKSTINGEEPNAYNPIIPEGYIPIDTDTSKWGNGTSAPTENDVDHGLVITDNLTDGNEWVWVPVPNPKDLYEVAEEPIAITGGSELEAPVINGVTTDKYTKSGIISDYYGLIERDKPNDTQSYYYCEPDIVVGDDGTEYDVEYYADAGFISLENMAKTMVDEYSEMIASIEKYKGFYIGRYELSSEGVKKDKETLTEVTWYTLYAKCKEVAANDTVKARMMWGCQWDAACNWIANKGEKKDIIDSRNWGNYRDSIAPANSGNYVQKEKKNTGSNEAWKANNLYDIAGNCNEWSQEASRPDRRANRGGSYGIIGSAASDRSCYLQVVTTSDDYGSRSILIV